MKIDRSLILPFAPPSLPMNFSWLPRTLLDHCHWLRQSFLSHAKASFSLWSVDLLQQIFTSYWSLHPFPSIRKTSSIIPIHKMERPLDSPASFRPIFLTSCISKLFERIILSHLLFFLKFDSIISPRQVGFHSGRSIYF